MPANCLGATLMWWAIIGVVAVIIIAAMIVDLVLTAIEDTEP